MQRASTQRFSWRWDSGHLVGSSSGSSRSRGGSPSWTRLRRRCSQASRTKLYLSSAACSITLVASSNSALRATTRTPTVVLRTGTLSTRHTRSACVSTRNPKPSRTVEGPRIGRTRYAPLPTPHQPKVCPKSSLCFCKPRSDAKSKTPAIPNVELKRTRVKSSSPCWNLPCSTSFMEIQTSSKLEKKLETPVRTTPGTAARYPFATGLIKAVSAASLKANTARFNGSRGSAGLLPEVAQPASIPARSSAAHSLFALATRSASKFLLFSLSLRGFIVQELTNQIFQHDRGLREFKGIAAFQVDRIAPGRKADVLLAEQSRSHYLGGTVLGKLKAAVDVEGHHRLEAFVVEMDLADPADDHAGTFHRRADLQTADVFEFRLDR